jgi:hypothetical protein
VFTSTIALLLDKASDLHVIRRRDVLKLRAKATAAGKSPAPMLMRTKAASISMLFG